MRDYDRAPSTAHRTIHRLAALGVIALQTTLGRDGSTRFTFGVRFWRRSPVRRGMLARFAAVPGQVSAFDEPAPEPEPEPERREIPPANDDRPTFGVRPTFDELMRRYGFDRDRLVVTAAERRRRLGR